MKRQRNTRQRQLILDAVRARADHPSADHIYLDVHSIDPRISRGTVYRNLHLLAKNGELLEVPAPQANRFDYRLDFHHHLLCTGCGSVSNAPLLYDEGLDRDVAEQSGYAINRHCTTFEGLCPDCQRALENG